MNKAVIIQPSSNFALEYYHLLKKMVIRKILEKNLFFEVVKTLLIDALFCHHFLLCFSQDVRSGLGYLAAY